MSWFADLAGKAENILINLDQQTGAALRNQTNVKFKKNDKSDSFHTDMTILQKKRPIARNLKGVVGRKLSPTNRAWENNLPPAQQISQANQGSPPTNQPPKRKISPEPRARYNLHRCPKTLVSDDNDRNHEEKYGYRARRNSLPEEFDKGWLHKMEMMERENNLLKNEVNVINKENQELVHRLQVTEDGESSVDRSNKECINISNNLERSMHENLTLTIEKDAMKSQIELLKSQVESNSNADNKYREQEQELQLKISVLREKNEDLEELVKILGEQTKEKDTVQNKTESDLRHAHSTINLLQNEADKAREECRRLEREWESYKHRVKSMLSAKDKEINTLQQGVCFSEDTKVLIDQVENLKEERTVLSDAVNRVRGECGDMKHYMETLERRHHASERVVVALRDALKDERSARTRAEASCNSLAKELKALQIETSEVIANLKESLQEKDLEQSTRDTSSTDNSDSTGSAINVADFNVNIQDDVAMMHLTEKLVQRQNTIDMLMADNNMLKIQLDKLETKYKRDVQRGHSVVAVQENGCGTRSRTNQSTSSVLSKASRWFGALSRQHPLFRVFIVIYMISLHLWVLTVLLTTSPDDYNTHAFNYRPQT